MQRWYVVHTQPRSEERALWHLCNQGFRCFLPKLRKVSRHARREKLVLEPLFPRYLFTSFDSATTHWSPINGTRGVIGLIADGSAPRPVPAGIVESLQAEADGVGVTPLAVLGRLWKGCKVRITAGAFGGQVAEMEALPANGGDRVRLLLCLLGRATSIEVPAYAIEPA